MSISAEPSSAVRGLTILAAGPAHAKQVNLAAMMRQRADMNTVLMTLGSWMSSHPPIVDRIAALDRALAGEKVVAGPAVLGAVGLITIGIIVPLAGGVFLMQKMMSKLQEQVQEASSSTPEPTKVTVADVPAAVERAQRDMRELAAVADAYRAKTGRYPEDSAALYALWRLEHPSDPELLDPFDGQRYGYSQGDGEYTIMSAGDERPGVTTRLSVTSN